MTLRRRTGAVHRCGVAPGGAAGRVLSDAASPPRSGTEDTMRVMLKSQLDIEAANLAIADGSINAVFDKAFGACRPAATYFLTEQGRRTVYAIFALTSLDQIPILAEPLFQSLGATVDFM